MLPIKEFDRTIEGLMGLGLHIMAKPKEAAARTKQLLLHLEPQNTPLKVPTGHGPKIDALVEIAAHRAERFRVAQSGPPDPFSSELRGLGRALIDILGEIRGHPKSDELGLRQ